MEEQIRVPSIGPEGKQPLPEVTSEKITEPGAYVDLDSGDLYRIPEEALLHGASPLIRKESAGSLRLVQVSKSPYITILEARMICAEYNIRPNF